MNIFTFSLLEQISKTFEFGSSYIKQCVSACVCVYVIPKYVCKVSRKTLCFYSSLYFLY